MDKQEMYTFSLLTAENGLRAVGHDHPEVEVCLVLAGTVSVQLQGASHTLTAGDIYTVAPNAVHACTGFSEDARLVQLQFLLDAVCTHREHFFYRHFLQPLSQGALLLPAVLPAGHPENPELQALLVQLRDAQRPVDRFATLMEFCLQIMPLCDYSRDDLPDKAVGNNIVRHCMGIIRNNYNSPIRLKWLAEELCLHPNYLCALFKAHTGQTVFEYLLRFRMEVAAGLLRKETLPVSKIAEVVGFPSKSLFYKKFRQLMGETPTSYRKKYSILSPLVSSDTPGV